MTEFVDLCLEESLCDCDHDAPTEYDISIAFKKIFDGKLVYNTRRDVWYIYRTQHRENQLWGMWSSYHGSDKIKGLIFGIVIMGYKRLARRVAEADDVDRFKFERIEKRCHIVIRKLKSAIFIDRIASVCRVIFNNPDFGSNEEFQLSLNKFFLVV